MRLIEWLLHLPDGFLGRATRLRFDPHWPGQTWIDGLLGRDGWGAGLYNTLLIAAAVALVIYLYRREQAPRKWRLIGGILRAMLLLGVIALLNHPLIEQLQQRIEPSVLAVMIDDSASMKVPDAGSPDDPRTRLAAVQALLGRQSGLLKSLAERHIVNLYRFGDQTELIGRVELSHAASQPAVDLHTAIDDLKPDAPGTQLTGAVQSVLSDLQGQRLAGVVILTDGRQTPNPPDAASIAAIQSYGVKLFPVPVGTERSPKNVLIESMDIEPAAFVGDLVNVKATLRADGYPQGADVKVQLLDDKTGHALLHDDGTPAQQAVHLPSGQATVVQIPFKAQQVGPLQVRVVVTPLPGELEDTDNQRVVRLDILDAKINVLYVEGYPRWDYRYLKTQLIRDQSINISCLLTGADANFAQEGDPPQDDFPGPISQFPNDISQLLKYDVVLFGDVDPRRFTDRQLQMLSDFVSRKGGGFEMIAGPQNSPWAWRNTPVAPILPITIPANATGGAADPSDIVQGFRPQLTPAGEDSGIFRFLADPKANKTYIEAQLPVLFWYAMGIGIKPGVGQVLAEHPRITSGDGQKAPLLVAGRFGAGRTLFCGFDESWRWRFYTGEAVFDTFWIQQIRFLARGRKLGQRRFIFTASKPTYDLGDAVRLNLQVLDADLQQQLPPELTVGILDASGQLISRQHLRRTGADSDEYTASFSADHPGQFTVRLEGVGDLAADLPLTVTTPRIELLHPQADPALLARLADQTGGRVIPLDQAAHELPRIASARKVIPLAITHPLWDTPLALFLLAGIVIAEWIVRKAGQMV